MVKENLTQLNDWREIRRLHAWELYQQGWSQLLIAQELGVTQGAVSQWIKRTREGGGIEALRHQPAPGRQPSLTDEQFAEIPALISLGASAFSFQGDHWTIHRITILLKQVFGVSYHPGHVSRLLQKHCPDWRNQKKA
jgi:transposase